MKDIFFILVLMASLYTLTKDWRLVRVPCYGDNIACFKLGKVTKQ